MLLDDNTFRRLCKAREMLAGIPGDEPAVRRVAREAGMSPFHFIRQFRALFGVTPHQFRINLRMERAKHLLACGQHSVTATCVEVGMSSLGSFSDAFQRRVGDAPSAYQRQAMAMGAPPGEVPQELIPGCLTLMSRTGSG